MRKRKRKSKLPNDPACVPLEKFLYPVKLVKTKSIDEITVECACTKDLKQSRIKDFCSESSNENTKNRIGKVGNYSQTR